MQEEAELWLSDRDGAVTDNDLTEAERQLSNYRSRKAAIGKQQADSAKARKPEDVSAPSKFPVGLWPYDVYVLDEDVLVRHVHNEFKSFQEVERWDERLYDDRLAALEPRTKVIS